MRTPYFRKFILSEDHLKLLRAACVGWQDWETGAPEIDPKRPYGNSGVAEDVCRILGWPRPYEAETDEAEALDARALAFHRETETALQIVLVCGPIAGNYRRTDEYDCTSWVKEN